MINKKQIMSIEDIKSSISIDGSLNFSSDIILPENTNTIIVEAFSIIHKYRSPRWLVDIPSTEIQTDIVRLQAMQSTLIYYSGKYLSSVSHLNESMKIARSKIKIQIKNEKTRLEKEGNSLKATLEDIESLCYTETENLYIQLVKEQQISDLIRYVYYSIRDLVKILDGALQRFSKMENTEPIQ